MTPLDPLALALSAFISGLLMFLAPCTLPIVPGYLAFIAGVPADATEVRGARRRIMLNALAFVIGFSVIFILLGTFAGVLGQLLGPWRYGLSRVAGAIIIVFGFTMLGILRLPIVSSTAGVRIPHFITLGRPESSFLIGALFALGWSPCIGPILGTILLFASTSSTALEGALLLAIFSIGLGLPFLLAAFFLHRAGALIAHMQTLIRALSIFGGVMLVLIGIVMVAGNTAFFVNWALQYFDTLYRPLLPYM